MLSVGCAQAKKAGQVVDHQAITSASKDNAGRVEARGAYLLQPEHRALCPDTHDGAEHKPSMASQREALLPGFVTGTLHPQQRTSQP